jgi:hypothetical protein
MSRLLFATAAVVSAILTANVKAFAPVARSVQQRGVAAAQETASVASHSSSSSCTRLLTSSSPVVEENKGAGKILRAALLTDVNGNKVQLGDKILSSNNKPSVVVFLRHLGWPYCWSYAKEWCDTVAALTTPLQQLQPEPLLESSIITIGDDEQRSAAAAAVGLLFVSIGDAEKLQTFLELNPHIPPSLVFVDDYDFEAYTAAGFGSFDDVDKEQLKSVKMKAPNMGGLKKWWQYLTNVMALSPVEKGKEASGIPEGVKRLGGTVVVNGDDIVYKWSDCIPGDTPNVDDVMAIVKRYSTTQT